MKNSGIDYFVICESVIIGQDGRYSFINMFDSVETDIPTRINKLSFALSIETAYLRKLLKTKKTGLIAIELKDPDDEIVVGFRVEVTSEEVNVKGVTHLFSNLDVGERGGLDVNQPGDYTAYLLFNGEPIANRKLLVEQKLDKKEA